MIEIKVYNPANNKILAERFCNTFQEAQEEMQVIETQYKKVMEELSEEQISALQDSYDSPR